MLRPPLPVVLLLLAISACSGQDAGFLEKFALATDRTIALKELIPGTDDYYYYHALHYQTQGQSKELRATLKEWEERSSGPNGRRDLLKARQTLLDYSTDPATTLAWLKEKFSLTFDHQRQSEEARAELPSTLDPAAISFAVFEKRAIENTESLENVTGTGLYRLPVPVEKWKLSEIRSLLKRLTRPDFPGLVGVIHRELNEKGAKFGDFPIHTKLTADQLAELQKLRPALVNNETFTAAVMDRMRPLDTEDADRDSAVREAWLNRLWAYASRLNANANPLKANLLYHLLALDEKLGRLDEKRLLAYLKLPRPVPYVNPRYKEDRDIWKFPATLHYDPSAFTGTTPVGDDEPLLRRLVIRYLTKAENWDAIAPLVSDQWLRSVLAEAKLLSGAPQPQRWMSLVSPESLQSLRDRTDIDFDPSSKQTYAPDDVVALDLWLKNVPSLLVRVYEINTANVHRTTGEQVNTALDLDGLTANHERKFDYKDAPILRTKQTFAFPELNAKRGVWIIEFVGNGKASRALIQKGGLRSIVRQTSAGTMLTVLDEKLQQVPKAFAMIGPKRFAADEKGLILLPLSTQPGPQKIIIDDGNGFTALETIELRGENYTLDARFHVPRESLLPGNKATLLLRPLLKSNGRPVLLDSLENVKVTLASTTLDGTPATAVFPFKKLAEDKETTIEFAVPDRLEFLSMTLTGEVKSALTGSPVQVSSKHALDVNGITKSGQVGDLHLSRNAGAWVLQELGLNGEPRPNREVNLHFTRPEFTTSIPISMKTDATGSIALGTLEGITSFTATHADGLTRTFTLLQDHNSMPDGIHAKAGESVIIPWPGDKLPGPGEVSLFERRASALIRQVPLPEKLTGGYLAWKNLTPGTYSLFVKGREFRVRVSPGEIVDGHLLTGTANLQLTTSRPLSVTGMQQGEVKLPDGKSDAALVFHIGNVSPETRVHLFASRFLPEFDAMASLGVSDSAEPTATRAAWMPSVYLSARNIGHEYRYVLDRRTATRFAGNTLARPGLLINPWEIAETKTEKEVLLELEKARKGELLPKPAEPMAENDRSPITNLETIERQPREPVAPRADLSFLATPGPVALNLKPDATGHVIISRAALGDRQYLRVVAVDRESSAVRDFSFAGAALPPRDLRLSRQLEPRQHFSQQNRITLLEKDATFRFDDALAAQFQSLGHLGSVHQLFSNLTQNPLLAEFSWLLEWPTFDDAKKRQLYSKYACHELHFFLARKDAAFFEAVIKPFLASKRDKTFMDEYLLGASLTRHLDPWHYGRLNTLERLLLAERIATDQPATRRLAEDWVNVQPVNRQRDLFLFETALRGRALTRGVRYPAVDPGQAKDGKGNTEGFDYGNTTAWEEREWYFQKTADDKIKGLGGLEGAPDAFYKYQIPVGGVSDIGRRISYANPGEIVATAADHTQFKVLNDVDNLWVTAVPGTAREPAPADAFASGGDESPISFKLNNILIDRLVFSEADVNEVLAFLRKEGIENDSMETDPDKKGVNIINRVSEGAKTVTLDLRNVTLMDAIKSVTEVAGVSFAVRPDALVVRPLGSAAATLTTRTFQVPVDFLSRAAAADDSPTDPFATGTESGKGLKGRPSARSVLESMGVVLPEGAFASYDASTGQLIVRNTAEQLDLVDTLTAGLQSVDGDFDNGVGLVPDGAYPGRLSDKNLLGLQKQHGAQGRDRLFRQQEQTRVWAEQNYYRLPIEAQTAELVRLNRFWRDYALWDGKSAFVSTNVADAAGSFTEMILTLAVLDLPFPGDMKAGKMETKENVLTLTPASRAILFHQDILPAEPDKTGAPLLVSQNFYREGDRYVEQAGEKADKFVSAEFLTGVVYGSQVVVTNPSSSRQRLDVLFQIPAGSLPVKATRRVQSLPVQIEPYRTATLDFHFYFPQPGKFAHFPVHVSRDTKTAASAAPFVFNVVPKPTINDPASWDYISQHATDNEVLSFLEQHNLYFLDLNKMLWRLKDADFFRRAVAHLKSRHVFHDSTWSYAVLHNAAPYITEFLMASKVTGMFGPAFESPLLTVDPVEQQTYQHLEYSPLVNARAHRLGGTRPILNDKFRAQWNSLLNVLACHAKLSAEENLAVAGYMALQDRIEEALEFFAKVDRAGVAEKLQYEYLRAWLAMCQEDTATARRIATAFTRGGGLQPPSAPVEPQRKSDLNAEKNGAAKNGTKVAGAEVINLRHDVPQHWRDKFAALNAQLDELDGKPVAVPDMADREAGQDALAEKEPAISLAVENKTVVLKYRNLSEVIVNYYPIDLEFLFSSSPFVSQDAARFGTIRPKRSETVMLADGDGSQIVAVPGEFQSQNVLVEVTGGGVTKSAAVYANSLDVQVSESFGQLTINHAGEKKPVSKAYVKVFADLNGTPVFYKDGYTDLRGKFDYASLSTDDLNGTRRFAILVMSEAHGALVKEVKPPAR